MDLRHTPREGKIRISSAMKANAAQDANTEAQLPGLVINEDFLPKITPPKRPR